MGFLDFWPKDDTEGTTTIIQADETANDLVSSPIRHGNTSVDEGYATLYVELIGNVSDSVVVSLGLYVDGQISDTKYFALEDYLGATSFNPAAAAGASAMHIFSLSRQNFWTVAEGLVPRVTKTGANGALTVNWRLLQR
jgi:hypothetical protein